MSGNLSGLGFNANEVEPNAGFDPLPAGEYDAAIVKADLVTTKAGDGRYIKLELQILNGQYQNRLVWDNLNIWNPNAEAVTIAKGTLSAICRAINVPSPNDTSELCDKPLRIKLAVKKDPVYGDGNVVKAYKPRTAMPTPGPVNAPVAAHPQQPAMAGAVQSPW
jgi:hypothetical protein